MTKPGRNDPCPCGSGVKYKRCCEGKQAEESWWARYSWHIVIAAIAIAVAGAAATIALQSGPSGAGPERVWSEEHGHWHTVGGSGGGLPCP